MGLLRGELYFSLFPARPLIPPFLFKLEFDWFRRSVFKIWRAPLLCYQGRSIFLFCHLWKTADMTRLNISFHARVPTVHPSMLMTLLSVLSVLRLFGISVTLATPSSMLPTLKHKQNLSLLIIHLSCSHRPQPSPSPHLPLTRPHRRSQTSSQSHPRPQPTCRQPRPRHLRRSQDRSHPSQHRPHQRHIQLNARTNRGCQQSVDPSQHQPRQCHSRPRTRTDRGRYQSAQPSTHQSGRSSNERPINGINRPWQRIGCPRQCPRRSRFPLPSRRRSSRDQRTQHPGSCGDGGRYPIEHLTDQIPCRAITRWTIQSNDDGDAQ